jgi:hypothetical protein
MVSVPLGLGAYQRTYAGEPTVRLENRYVEKDPSNTREKLTLIARAGSNALVKCAGGIVRGTYSKLGLFNGDLFVVSGPNLWRVDVNTQIAVQITGTIAGDGNPYIAWMKGIGYEYLFIADGTALQYFSTHAQGTLTLTGNIQEGMVIDINGKYYGWSATVDHGAPAGTVGNPYWALLDSTGLSTAERNTNSLANMVLAINGTGINGHDYSTAIIGPNTDVTATSTDFTIVLSSIVDGTPGNAIVTTVTVSGGGSIAFGAGTLTGGGGTTLYAVTGAGSGEVVKALCGVSSYVLASVGNTNKFYWLNPGEVTIDPLNFASKESQPDNILDMLTVGDQALITGNGSTENWYATGNALAPFAPVEGRTYARGVIEGTPAVVSDGVILIGEDGIVYQIGYKYGGQAQWGVHRISNHAIEERIRVQLRFEQGLPP